MVDYDYTSNREEYIPDLKEAISRLEKSVHISTEENVILEVQRIGPHPNPITKVPGEIHLEPRGGKVTCVNTMGYSEHQDAIHQISSYGIFVQLPKPQEDYFIRMWPWSDSSAKSN